MDGPAFRVILMDYAIKRRQKYEHFLQAVSVLSTLTRPERSIIADALEAVYFEDGDVIIRQGEQGDRFYIIEDGDVVVTQARTTRGALLGEIRNQIFFFFEHIFVLNVFEY